MSKVSVKMFHIVLHLYFLLLLITLVKCSVVSPSQEDKTFSATSGTSSSFSLSKGPDAKQPHIIFILADDMGWNDASLHGSNQIPTPNIDALALNGVLLNSYYTQPLCTPSRAALLTGRYPIRNGMQHNVILEPEARGLPIDEVLLPEQLRRLGYATHAIGKWHLGFSRTNYTPLARGFDSHYGFWNGYQDYYTHSVQASFVDFDGYDMRRNEELDWSRRGRYSTTVFTEEAEHLVRSHPPDKPLFLFMAHLAPHAGNYEAPLQAPAHLIRRYGHIADHDRRVYAAMVHALDESVGHLMTTLQEKGMLENSVVIFASDNGAITSGIHANVGSNWPLKGIKGGPWEGAVRAIGSVWSPLIVKPHRVSNELMHITDWFPTLLKLAGASNPLDNPPLDGVDVWDSLSEGLPSPRKEFVVNIDDRSGYAAIRINNLKYVNGTTLLGYEDVWLGESGLKESFPGFDWLSKVRKSPAALAMEKSGSPLPSDSRLLRIREQAKIKCAGVDKRFPACRPLLAPCVFNLADDPCEQRNLWGTPFLRERDVLELEDRLMEFRAQQKPPGNLATDYRSNPVFWNGTWTNWEDQVDILFSGPDDDAYNAFREQGQRLARWGRK